MVKQAMVGYGHVMFNKPSSYGLLLTYGLLKTYLLTYVILLWMVSPYLSHSWGAAAHVANHEHDLSNETSAVALGHRPGLPSCSWHENPQLAQALEGAGGGGLNGSLCLKAQLPTA